MFQVRQKAWLEARRSEPRCKRPVNLSLSLSLSLSFWKVFGLRSLRASGVRKEKCCSSSSKRRSGKIEKCLQVQGRGDGGGGQKVLQASPPLQVSFFADFACQSCFGFFFFFWVDSVCVSALCHAGLVSFSRAFSRTFCCCYNNGLQFGYYGCGGVGEGGG